MNTHSSHQPGAFSTPGASPSAALYRTQADHVNVSTAADTVWHGWVVVPDDAGAAAPAPLYGLEQPLPRSSACNPSLVRRRPAEEMLDGDAAPRPARRGGHSCLMDAVCAIETEVSQRLDELIEQASALLNQIIEPRDAALDDPQPASTPPDGQPTRGRDDTLERYLMGLVL